MNIEFYVTKENSDEKLAQFAIHGDANFIIAAVQCLQNTTAGINLRIR